MKHYHSIAYGATKQVGNYAYASVKYDGSSICVEWNKKNGWVKFGTRHHLLDETDTNLGGVIPIFMEQFAQPLDQLFRTHKDLKPIQEITVYMEYFGAKSFAGQHEQDDPKALVLFDVNLYKKGLMSPADFYEIFGGLQVAELVWEGILTDEVIEKFMGETIPSKSLLPIHQDLPEGIVLKGGSGHHLWMCKVKTVRYKQKLQDKFGPDWERYL